METKPSVTYSLFLHREELRRRNVRYLRLTHTKVTLTDTLISKHARNIQECSNEDLSVMGREMRFKAELHHKMKRLHRLQQLGFNNVHPCIPSTDL